VVVAVPVGSSDTVARLAQEADSVVCPAPLADLGAVGLWYRDFRPVSDEEVIALLADLAELREAIAIADDGVQLPGELTVPAGARAAVVFAHGSGSSRLSPRNIQVAAALTAAGLGTLLFDLLTEPEAADRGNVFDIPLLAGRLVAATRWTQREPALHTLPVGYFGASTGAAAALCAAADMGAGIRAVVSRGGRPDLAGPRLGEVTAPTLLIVGGADETVLELNELALGALRCTKALAVVPGATHLFEEPGTLEQVASHAARWFAQHLVPPT
jgi:alpha-beta hydrolase superfamily lysophospholipase